jgi:prolyl 4-hydroxylase
LIKIILNFVARPTHAYHRLAAYGEDLGVRQGVPDSHKTEVEAMIQSARDYLHNVIFAEPTYRELRDVCKNKVSSCAYWAVLGECQNNPAYMNETCGPICQACEYQLKEVRCPLDPNAVDAYYPGDLQKMFERITTHPEFSQFEPKALSRPDFLPGDTEATAPYKLGPWIVTLENFLSSEEANRLVELGAGIGFQRSGKQGELKFDGTYETYYDEGRTSTNAWCADACLEDPVVKLVTERITNLTGTREANLEYFQILKYEVGQFYQPHNDYMPHHVRRQEGVRVLTVYLYLNDVEEGGGTNFPSLDLTVMPKSGKVVIWPSVLNEDPNARDDRTDHQALPVIKGVKYGEFAWFDLASFFNILHTSCNNTVFPNASSLLF